MAVSRGWEDNRVGEQKIRDTVLAGLHHLDIEEEKEIVIDGKLYYVDLVSDGVAIELKSDNISGVVRGIGQCKLYQKAGYDAILISPIVEYPDHILECYRDIGACICSLDCWEIKPRTRYDIAERVGIIELFS